MIIRGENIRLRLENAVIARATSCTLHLSANVADVTTKDTTSRWTENVVTGISWDASVDALVLDQQADYDAPVLDQPLELIQAYPEQGFFDFGIWQVGTYPGFNVGLTPDTVIHLPYFAPLPFYWAVYKSAGGSAPKPADLLRAYRTTTDDLVHIPTSHFPDGFRLVLVDRNKTTQNIDILASALMYGITDNAFTDGDVFDYGSRVQTSTFTAPLSFDCIVTERFAQNRAERSSAAPFPISGRCWVTDFQRVAKVGQISTWSAKLQGIGELTGPWNDTTNQ